MCVLSAAEVYEIMQLLSTSLRGWIRPLMWLFLCLPATWMAGQCYAPSSQPTQYCFPAPVVCLLNVCYATSPWPDDFFAEPEDWCMTTNPSNHPHYYSFQASSAFVEIFIRVTGCHGLALCGLQAVIINQCAVGFNPWTSANVVACDALACVNETMILAPGNLVPGQYYWLMIDNDGDFFCGYEIYHVSGVVPPQITQNLSYAYPLDTVVCPGQTRWRAVAVPPLSQAQGYLWTGFPWAPGYHTSQYTDMAGGEWIDIPLTAPPGIYEICVVGFTACDTSDTPVCFDLEIRNLNGTSAPVTLCPEDFGNNLMWEGNSINFPGTYTRSYVSVEGCPYDSTKVYTSHPAPLYGFIDTILCDEFFLYEGIPYFNPGSYTLHYDNANMYGCDSFAILTLDISYIEATTNFYCLNGTFVFTSQIVHAVPSIVGIQYAWYRNGTTLVSTNPGFTTTLPGVYTLFVSYYDCEFPALTNPIVINIDELVPPPPPINAFDTVTCANEIAVYSVIPNLDPIMRYYEWTIDPPEVPFTAFDTLDSGIMVSWQGFNGGTICVRGINHCGVGFDSCFTVMVLPAPQAAFTMPSQVCADSVVQVEFTGIAGPDAFFLWNFAGATIHSGGTGRGPHTVSWSTPGTRTVSVSVAEVTCDTSTMLLDIQVEVLGQPVISCNSTVDAITFEWSPVPGALSYQVNVLTGPAGSVMNDTSYVVTGLAPGTIVQIEVIAMGIGACPSTSATLQCIAQDCPPRVVQIQIPSTIFCLGDVMGAIPLAATVDGAPASGTWSGPGVDPSGTFDPHHPSAGPGVHTIIFVYTEGTCIYQRSANVVVNDSPTASFTAASVICQLGNATIVYTGNASVNANYIWNFGSGIASGSGAGPYTVTWNTPGMHVITLQVQENGCLSNVFSHQIDVQPALTAPLISCFPTTSSVTIQWGTVPNATSYDVTHLFGPVGTVVGNQYIVNGLSPGDSVSIQITVSGNTICPDVVIEASCVAQECPMPVIQIAPVNSICLYTGTGTTMLQVTVTNGNGSGVWSGNGVTDVVQGIFNPNIAGPGTHLIEYQYMENGCTFVESITIQVYAPPVAVISNTIFTLTCDNQGMLVLNGSNSTGSGVLSYQWTTPNGLIIGATNQSTATAGSAGQYFLRVTSAPGMCEDVVSITLIEDTGLPDADAGADGLINCDITSVVLGGNSSSGPSITYAWSASNGGVIGSDPTDRTITALAGGTYTISVTDQDNGCTATDDVMVIVDTAQPSGMLSVGGILNCEMVSTTVSATVSPPGLYIYQWATSNGQILSGNGTAAIVVDRAGVYTLSVTSVANGCSDIISTEVFADPEVIGGLQVLIDYPECPGDQDGKILIVEVIGGMSPFTFAWNNQTSASGLLSLAPGTYTVTVTDANGCLFTETFVLPESVEMDPDIGIDLLHQFGETVTIGLTVTDPSVIADIAWGGLAPACAGCYLISFDAELTGNVIVTVTDINGCVESDTLRLTVEKNRNVYIPNVFSPNGDGINDVFNITGKLLTRIEYLRIFDRWGNLLYDQPPTPAGGSKGWDGTYAGKHLHPGVYVYSTVLVHSDGFEELLTGTVTLLR